MKTIKTLLAVVVGAAFLTSCSDTHEAIVRDQIEWMEEVTQVLEGVADGKVSSADAAARIKELGRKGGDFVDRKEALGSDINPEELQAIQTEYAEQSSQAFQNYMQAVEKLSSSGRLTQELASALENIDSP